MGTAHAGLYLFDSLVWLALHQAHGLLDSAVKVGIVPNGYRLYRGGGAEALRPGPKGRPRGSRPKPRARTREQELEERCRRLEAEVAYLKNCAPWSSGTGSDQGDGRGGVDDDATE